MRCQPDRHGHRLSLSVDEHGRGAYSRDAELERRRAGSDPGRYRVHVAAHCVLSAAHGNCPASLAGWVTAYLACEPRFTTLGVFTAHSTKSASDSWWETKLPPAPSHDPR